MRFWCVWHAYRLPAHETRPECLSGLVHQRQQPKTAGPSISRVSCFHPASTTYASSTRFIMHPFRAGRSRKRAFGQVIEDEAIGVASMDLSDPTSSIGSTMHPSTKRFHASSNSSAPTPLHSPTCAPSDQAPSDQLHSLGTSTTLISPNAYFYPPARVEALRLQPHAYAAPPFGLANKHDGTRANFTPLTTPAPSPSPPLERQRTSPPELGQQYGTGCPFPPSDQNEMAHLASGSNLDGSPSFVFMDTDLEIDMVDGTPVPPAPASSPVLGTEPMHPPPLSAVPAVPVQGSRPGRPKITLGFVPDCPLCLARSTSLSPPPLIPCSVVGEFLGNADLFCEHRTGPLDAYQLWSTMSVVYWAPNCAVSRPHASSPHTPEHY